MKYFFLGLNLLVIINIHSVAAQSNYSNYKWPAKSVDLENSLLWKIEGKDINTSYLYGTFHLLPLKDFIMTEKVLSAFEVADKIVLELDMDDPSLQMEIMKHVTRQDNAQLDKSLSAIDFKKLDHLLRSGFGADVQMFNNWHPAMVGTFLIRNYIEGEPASFEASFVEMASKKNKEILGIETPAEHLAAFEKIAYEEQIKDLEEMLNEEEKVKEDFKKLIAFYKDENIDGLYNYLIDYYNNPEKVELLLNQRNRSWIPKLESFSKKDVSFFAVGAGHLSGKDGIINLLRKKGYKVTPVYNLE